MKKIKYIVIHCSATRSDRTYSPEQMLRDHRQRGFRTWGYHYYVRRDGMWLALRPETVAGAHAYGYNRCSIGVCYEGGLMPDGMPADTRTNAQQRTLRRLVAALLLRYPEAQVVGHRDLSPDSNADGCITPDEWIKLCPCFDARNEYVEL